jgi:hypothetical protein
VAIGRIRDFTQIHDDGRKVFLEQDVVRLQVSMGDRFRLHVVQIQDGVTDLNKQVQNHRLGERVFPSLASCELVVKSAFLENYFKKPSKMPLKVCLLMKSHINIVNVTSYMSKSFQNRVARLLVAYILLEINFYSCKMPILWS